MKKLFPLGLTLFAYFVSMSLVLMCSELFQRYQNVKDGIMIVTGIVIAMILILCIAEVVLFMQKKHEN